MNVQVAMVDVLKLVPIQLEATTAHVQPQAMFWPQIIMVVLVCFNTCTMYLKAKVKCVQL